MRIRPLLTMLAVAMPATLGGAAALGPAGAAGAGPQLVPLAIQAPDDPAAPGTTPACTMPPTPSGFVQTYAAYHCYTPQDITAAYDVDAVHSEGNYGQGQTIVLVDAYGSPTAAGDLQQFHDTFYPNLPNPDFSQVFPLGNPQYNNTYHGNGLSGPNGAAGWSGEATLDIEWSYAIAPEAHIVLLAVPPAETLGVQGFPNLFKAIEWAIGNYPAGTIFSQSFGVAEPTFGGAAAVQTARFDQVYAMAAAKGDTVFASAGDSGTTGTSKQHKENTSYSFPTAGWPASSPYLTAAGGTQLQYGWRWDPTSDNVLNYTSCSDQSCDSEAVWNEAWLGAATGGGPSAIYARPSYQDAQAGVIGGNARGVPDLSWNAAVNGGVDVYITAYPNAQRAGWHVYGGTSAASPQLAGVIALADEMLPAGTTVGALNPWLYKLMDSTGTSSASFTGSTDFRDIVPQTYGIYTLENNTLGANPDGSTPTGGVPGWPTLSGWDMTTGFGTPRVAQFIADLDSLITS